MKNPFRSREDPEVKAAYEKAKREARLERAAKEGRKAGLKKPKSFLDSMGEFGETMMSGDFGGGLFGEPSRKKKKRKRKK